MRNRPSCTAQEDEKHTRVMETAGSDHVPGASSETSDALPKHTMIGEFEIVGIIGEGGFGTVYLAIDHSLQRRVALKEYRPALLATRQGQSVMVRSTRHADAFEAGLKSFMNEARTLARFDHPALIHVYRVWQQNNTAYMAMPLCEGKSLTMMIRDNPGIATQSWVLSMIMPLLEAVGTLHGSNIYHRDIAPDNVLIQDNGQPMLLDFGAARQIATDRTQALTVILKPGYAPIEQFADDPSMKQGPWTDIYALGATMYFAITGRAPPNSVARLAGDPMAPLAAMLDGSYAPEFLDAIDKALAVRPRDRPQSIAEFRTLLRGIPAPVERQDEPVAPAAGAPGSAASPAITTGATAVIAAAASAAASATAATAATAAAATAAAANTAAATAAPAMPAAEARPDRGTSSSGTPGSDSSGMVHESMPLGAQDPVERPAAEPREPAMARLVRSTRALADRATAATRGAATRLAPVVRSRRGLQIGAGAAAILLLVLAVTLVRNPFAPPPSTNGVASDRSVPTPTSAPPPTAAVVVPGSSVAPATINTENAGTADGATPAGAAASGPAAAEQAPSPVPEPAANGTLTLAIRPWGEVIVNGERKGPSPPLKRVTLPEGTYRIEISNPGFPSYTTDVQMARNKSITVAHQFK